VKHTEYVVDGIRDNLGLEPTGRPAKSTSSISDKLRRESIRLSQIQDIAGCRVIAPDILRKMKPSRGSNGSFGELVIIDRRDKPSHVIGPSTL
jgi:putative GTP pyrophosphokinase